MEHLLKLKGKTGLVTGASRGIGRSIALALGRAGADVVVNCSSSVEEAEKVVQEIKNFGRNSISIKADVADKPSVNTMIDEVIGHFGKIDILVNNAGIATISSSENLEEQVWRRGIDVMLTGTFFCSQAVGKAMIQQKNGKIINIASINGIVGFPERASYCSAKAGVMALTKVLASEWAKYNVNVNAIAPGYVETELVNNLVSQSKLKIDDLKKRTPSGKLTSSEDVAEAVLFLASDSSRSINGQTIIIDGGWTAYGYLESWLANNTSIK